MTVAAIGRSSVRRRPAGTFRDAGLDRFPTIDRDQRAESRVEVAPERRAVDADLNQQMPRPNRFLDLATPAADVARAYARLVEGQETGAVVDAGRI
jgi:hypothetical protein